MATAPPSGFAEPLTATARPLRAGTTPPLRATIQAHVLDRNGGWVPLEFVVDSGAGVTTIPWSMASCLGIPIGTNRVVMQIVTAQGIVSLNTWRHIVELEFPALPGHRFVFDCQFPDVPSNVPAVLGIGGDVLRQLTIAFDGAPHPPHAPYGFVRIELVATSPTAGPPSP